MTGLAIKVVLALKMLTAKPVTAVVKLMSLTFAIILIFMQLALYELVLISAVQQYDMLDFDLLLTSSGYIAMAQPSAFSQDQLVRVLSDPAVETATPFYLASVNWRNPEDGLDYPIFVLGAPTQSPAFVREDVRKQLYLLNRDQGVLFDLRSIPMYGPREIGLNTVAGGKPVQILGHYSNGAGFISGGAIIVSDATFFALDSGRQDGDVNLGLIKLKGGEPAQEVVGRLQHLLPENIRVWERAELETYEREFWTEKKPLGIMFSSGVLMGFLIGAVIFYQVLATDILKHLREFATMKAIGYSNADVSHVVLIQAVIYGICCFVPALLTAMGMYELFRVGAAINIYMTVTKAMLVFLMTLALCCGCSWLALRKIRTLDPAELF